MPAHTTDFKGDYFSLCCGDISPNSFFQIIYRNVQQPNIMNGNVTQWLYLTKGSGKIVIDGTTEIEFLQGELSKVPSLHHKKVEWYGFDEGASWVSFNPNPLSDDYDAVKVNVNDTTVLQSKNYERHLVLFEGDCVAKNQNNYSVTLEQSKTVKISPGSSITLSSQHGCVVGLFWRSDAVL